MLPRITSISAILSAICINSSTEAFLLVSASEYISSSVPITCLMVDVFSLHIFKHFVCDIIYLDVVSATLALSNPKFGLRL